MEVVPFSGIQIIDFEVDLSDFERPRKRFGLKDEVLYPLSIEIITMVTTNSFQSNMLKL